MNNKEIIKENKNQTLTLTNRQNLSISGITKIISIKPDLIQLDSNNGGILIGGNTLELRSLDNETGIAEIVGIINSIKYINSKEKESLLRKIFK